MKAIFFLACAFLFVACHKKHRSDDALAKWQPPVFRAQNGEYTILYNKNNNDYVLQTGISSNRYDWLPLEAVDTAYLNSRYFPVYFDSTASIYISDVKQATHFKDTTTARKAFKAYWDRVHENQRKHKIQDSIAAVIEKNQTDYRPINQKK